MAREIRAGEFGSAEAVAYKLFERICYVEKKDIGAAEVPKGWERPSRSWIFATYGECLRAVRSREPEAGAESLEAKAGYAGGRRVPRAAILASDPI